MTRKKLLLLVGSVFLAVMLAVPVVVGCAGPAPSPTPSPTPTPTPDEDKVIHWNFNLYWNVHYTHGGAAVEWAKRVKEATNGQLIITPQFDGTAGIKINQIFTAVKENLIESSYFDSPISGSEVAPWWSLFDFYNNVDCPEQGSWVMDKMRSQVEKDVSDFGVLLGCFLDQDPYGQVQGIWTDWKIEKLEDFKGMKVRLYFITGGKPTFENIGFSALYVPAAECYSALQTGLVDGVVQTPSSGVANHYYEVADYFYAIQPAVPAFSGYIFNKEAFDALPKDVQDGLMKATREFEDWYTNEVVRSGRWSDFTPGIADMSDEEAAVYLREEEGTIFLKVPELQKLISESAIKAMEKWAAETGPVAQRAYELTLEARENISGGSIPCWDNMEVLELE